MQKSNILWKHAASSSRQMLYSRIEPDHNQNMKQNKYIIHKIPKADKAVYQNYQQRCHQQHTHAPHIFIESTSHFYHCIYLELCQKFEIKEMGRFSINQRAKILVEILQAAQFYAALYGYFYITEKMIGWNSSGRVTLWIHEDVIQNKRKYPIHHGKLNQQFFVSDFKAAFGAVLRELRDFRRASSVQSLIALLKQDSIVQQSRNANSQIQKESYINCSTSCIAKSQINLGLQFGQQNSLNTLKKAVSFSYLPNQLESSVIHTSKILNTSKMLGKTLSSSTSLQHIHFGGLLDNQNRLKESNNSIGFSKIFQNSPTANNLSSSMLPKVQFSYGHQQCWKKKINSFDKNDIAFVQNLTKSQSFGIDLTQSTQQSSTAQFKFGLPLRAIQNHAPTVQTLESLMKQKQFRAQHENMTASPAKQADNQIESHKEKPISEQANNLQLDLEILFSQSDGQIYSRQEDPEMQLIMEQFENVLS